MSAWRPWNNGSHLAVGRAAFLDFEVAWAGDCPWAPGYCFGSEDGRVKFVDLDGVRLAGPFDVAPSREAVSGVAFAGNLMGVATRSEVVFLHVPRPGEGQIESGIYHGGAHDVVATATGRLIAPMGINGLLTLGAKQSGSQNVAILKSDEASFNFYRVAALFSVPDLGDVIACAGRRDGFAILTIGASDSVIGGRRVRSPDVDFVDVCSLGSERQPLAAAALGLDGSIHLTGDALTEPSPKIVRFDGIPGRPYRIFACQGHILLLTSKGVYTILGLAARFLEGQRIDRPLRSRWLKLYPVEASLTSRNQLLVVMPDSVYQVEIETLALDDDAMDAPPGEEDAPHETAMTSAPAVNEEAWEMFAEHTWEKAERLELASSL